MKIYILYITSISGLSLIQGVYEDKQEAILDAISDNLSNWWIDEQTVIMKGDN